MNSGTLVCLPHAGGTAQEYRSWRGRLGGWNVFPVSYPGRESHFAEPLRKDVGALAEWVLARLSTSPVALFGHSLGALVAFEVAHRMERAGRAPVALVVAGQGAPHVARDTLELHRVDDARLLAGLRALGGIDPEVEAEPELVELLLPRLRADIEAAETYPRHHRTPLGVPILALGGRGDQHVSAHDLEAWSKETHAHATVRLFDGDHFFVRQQAAEVQAAVAAMLGAAAPSRA